MLGLACCFAVDRNIPIIAPIHDALLIEGPATDIEDIAREMKRCMIEASRAVLGGASRSCRHVQTSNFPRPLC